MNGRTAVKQQDRFYLPAISRKIIDTVRVIFAISGFVLEHNTVLRTAVMILAYGGTLYLGAFSQQYIEWALPFYAVSTVLYIGFLYAVLSKNGLRTVFVSKFGEERGFIVYQGLLGFLFFMNGASIGFLASAYQDLHHFPKPLEQVFRTVGILFIVAGFTIKIWATKVVSVDIYYWKDMFLGRKIRDFVVEGPYKYVNNPMYGLGHLQTYGIAIFYMSDFGFLAALLNQLLVFSFYFLEEKKFIKEVYLQKQGSN